VVAVVDGGAVVVVVVVGGAVEVAVVVGTVVGVVVVVDDGRVVVVVTIVVVVVVVTPGSSVATTLSTNASIADSTVPVTVDGEVIERALAHDFRAVRRSLSLPDPARDHAIRRRRDPRPARPPVTDAHDCRLDTGA
jgi:hypothetical protein